MFVYVQFANEQQFRTEEMRVRERERERESGHDRRVHAREHACEFKFRVTVAIVSCVVCQSEVGADCGLPAPSAKWERSAAGASERRTWPQIARTDTCFLFFLSSSRSFLTARREESIRGYEIFESRYRPRAEPRLIDS